MAKNDKAPSIGHNSGDEDDDLLDTSPAKMEKARKKALDQKLIQMFERIERLEEEKKGIQDDIKDVYAEAKATGYDAKIMKAIYRLRKMKPDDRREMDLLLETYKSAVGLD